MFAAPHPLFTDRSEMAVLLAFIGVAAITLALILATQGSTAMTGAAEPAATIDSVTARLSIVRELRP